MIPECVWILKIHTYSFALTPLPTNLATLSLKHSSLQIKTSLVQKVYSLWCLSWAGRQRGVWVCRSSRQAWVIKKEIRRSVWERPSGPPLICSQLIVLAFYCFLLGWQIRERPANKKPAQIHPRLGTPWGYASGATGGRGVILETHGKQLRQYNDRV